MAESSDAEVLAGAPTRVAYLFMTLGVGGAEELARVFLRRLPKRYEGMICCLGGLGEMGRELRAAGDNVHELNAIAGKRFSFRAVRRLRRWLRENRISIVHGHSYHADLYGRLAARPLGLPYVSHVHNVYARKKLHRAWINRLLARWTAKVLCVSEAVSEDVRRCDHVPAGKVEVLINAIDASEFAPEGPRAGLREEIGLRPDERLIGTVGSLTEKKNQGLLLEAVARCAARGVAVRCGICGEGKRRAFLEERIAALGLEGRARLAGVRRPVAPVLRELDLFVLTSSYEGVPLALLQAIACGAPVVVSDVPGITRVTGRGHEGVVPEMSAEAFAERIERFLRDPEWARALAARSRAEILPRFSHDAYMARLAHIYDEILRPGGRAGNAAAGRGAGS